MKKLLFVLLLLAVQNLYAQDTLVTHPKYRELFANTEFREDLYKLTKAEFDKMYTKDQEYKILVVYSDPLIASQEKVVKFKGLDDLCNPLTQLELPTKYHGSGWANKKELETFVFDEKYIFRKEAAGPYNQDSAWGIMILNGPIYSVKTFGMSAYAKGKEAYSTKKYKFTLQKKLKSEYAISSNDPHAEESDIRFKGRMKSFFKECDEIVKNVEAEVPVPGYGKPDFLKMVLEFNEYVKNNDKVWWEASIYPKVQYFPK